MDETTKFENSVTKVASWIEGHDYKGYDPGDGLNSFLSGRWRAAIGLHNAPCCKTIWKCPFNLRPYVGIRPMESTKARGYMAAGYLLRHRTTLDRDQKEKAFACLDWLASNRSPAHDGYSWAITSIS
jgi:hypothetical protein